MKNLLMALLLIATSTIVSAQDKCGDNLRTGVKFKLTRDKSADVKTKTTKESKVKIDVDNNTTSNITVRLDIISGGKIVQTLISAGKIAPGAKAVISNKILLMKGKQIEDMRIAIKNVDCKDTAKNLLMYQHKETVVMDLLKQTGVWAD